ncbi:NFX1-type zinc finger-containing protein 1-like [Rhinatrema bivittatum]|uniref:NFX1-type zinc finger-containing protein 1-like n=1 Tax=Rhinatrema bivittatum TaxID=194408 RepID=UPI0011262BC3|nr:NFX1-type zinc finger-containing protein 1-like [Rhinatrema bivittatum]
MLLSRVERQRSLGFQYSWISLKQLQDLKFLVDAGFPDVQDSLAPGGLLSPVETDDIKKISVFPTTQDIFLDPRRTLRPNLRSGSFENALSYLDIHFRLLREDFIKPLREGISACFAPKHLFSGASKRRKGLRLYKNVRIVRVGTMPTGVKYMATFDSPFTSWVSSKRLMAGSLVCLISTDSDEVLFGTVASYDREELLNSTVWLDLETSHQKLSRCLLRQKRFTMVESPAFFQVYQHVLEGLQEVDPGQLPFRRYIVECKSTALPPGYLKGKDTVAYNLSVLSPSDGMTIPNVAALEDSARPVPRDAEGNPTPLELEREPTVSPHLEISPGEPGEAPSNLELEREPTVSPNLEISPGEPGEAPSNLELEREPTVSPHLEISPGEPAQAPSNLELEREPTVSPHLEISPEEPGEAPSNFPKTPSTLMDPVGTGPQQAPDYGKLESVDPFDPHLWCPERFPHLDRSQMEALRAALTREFVLIQGPPGTGKTFLGLKIVQTLLGNHKHWRTEQNPILVVCYTNHALDQFLQGIISFQPQRVVRIGGKCRNQKLARYSLKNIRETHLQEVLTPAQRSRFHQVTACFELSQPDVAS